MVGSQFGGVSRLWSQFERAMAAGRDPNSNGVMTNDGNVNEVIPTEREGQDVPMEGAYSGTVQSEATDLPYGKLRWFATDPGDGD